MAAVFLVGAHLSVSMFSPDQLAAWHVPSITKASSTAPSSLISFLPPHHHLPASSSPQSAPITAIGSNQWSIYSASYLYSFPSISITIASLQRLGRHPNRTYLFC